MNAARRVVGRVNTSPHSSQRFGQTPPPNPSEWRDHGRSLFGAAGHPDPSHLGVGDRLLADRLLSHLVHVQPHRVTRPPVGQVSRRSRGGRVAGVKDRVEWPFRRDVVCPRRSGTPLPGCLHSRRCSCKSTRSVCGRAAGGARCARVHRSPPVRRPVGGRRVRRDGVPRTRPLGGSGGARAVGPTFPASERHSAGSRSLVRWRPD